MSRSRRRGKGGDRNARDQQEEKSGFERGQGPLARRHIVGTKREKGGGRLPPCVTLPKTGQEKRPAGRARRFDFWQKSRSPETPRTTRLAGKRPKKPDPRKIDQQIVEPPPVQKKERSLRSIRKVRKIVGRCPDEGEGP